MYTCYCILGIMEIWVFLAKQITQKPASQYHPGILAGITKPKSAFSRILKASNKLLQNLKKIIQWNFLLTNCLPASPPARLPSGKHNSIMAKTVGLIFSLFDIASSRDVLFGISQYIQCTHHGLTFILICVPFLLADIRFPACIAMSHCLNLVILGHHY